MVNKVFHIGLNRCGGQFISNLFRINGYNSVHWAGGALAEDIYYSRCVDEKPLVKWDNCIMFSNLESIESCSGNIIEGYKHYDYLDLHYPESLFIVGVRNINDWILSRYNYKNGEYAEIMAMRLGVKLKELGGIWEKDWENHLTQCKKYFRERKEFIEIDIDKFEEVDYISTFKPWFNIETVQNLPGKKIYARRKTYQDGANKVISGDTYVEGSANTVVQVARRISTHCIPSKSLVDTPSFSAWSNLVITGTIGSGRFYDRHGNQLPIARDRSGYFYFRRWHDKAVRPVGVLNDIVALDVPWANDIELTIDMQDARLFGCQPADAPPKPVISYCRRAGATNVFLWPLPGYHTIGAGNFLSRTRHDEIQFRDKMDKLVWRGNLSGHCSDVAAGVFNNPTYLIAKEIIDKKKSGKDLSGYLEVLDKNIRYRLVNEGYENSDYDFRLTPSPNGREALIMLGKEHLLDSYRDDSFLHKFKYVLSMRGFDTGSNFISAANTHSVVLKEEDGWELFYTDLFKPWVHYIPLLAGGKDVTEKLNWARRNPMKCEEIVGHAGAACRLLMDHNLRAKFLELTLLGYRDF